MRKRQDPWNSNLIDNRTKHETSLGRGRDIYYYVIESSWSHIFIMFFSIYLISNFLFATLYYIIPDSIHSSGPITFYDCFYFSVQTMATIGYGALSPQGHLSNILVTIEAAFGLIGVAITTGLIFAKISRPYAKIRFSQNAVINIFDGIGCLSFRIGNIRGNDIVEANVTLTALIDEKTQEGIHLRRMYDLKLQRSYSPFFNLTWNLFHPIDESSPLLQLNDIKSSLKAIAVTVVGHDGTFSTTVYGRHVYTAKDILRDKYFKGIMYITPNGHVSINYDDFDELV